LFEKHCYRYPKLRRMRDRIAQLGAPADRCSRTPPACMAACCSALVTAQTAFSAAHRLTTHAVGIPRPSFWFPQPSGSVLRRDSAFTSGPTANTRPIMLPPQIFHPDHGRRSWAKKSTICLRPSRFAQHTCSPRINPMQLKITFDVSMMPFG